MATEIIQQNWRKARKKHKCYLCGATINKGETYMWQKLVGDYHYEIKTCKFCYDNIIPTVWEEERIRDRFDPTLYPEDANIGLATSQQKKTPH